MAKKFVRNITNTKLEGANKEPLFTNTQNDILSDSKDAYIRNRNEYFPLTKSITDIKSEDKSVKITRKNSTVYIKNLAGGDKDLTNPKTITVRKPIQKEETEDNITLSLDPTIANLANPKEIKASYPIVKNETDKEITFGLKPLAEQIEVAGTLKKEVADKGVKLFTEDKKLQVTSPLEKKEENEFIKLSIDPKALKVKEKGINVIAPLEKNETNENVTLSLSGNLDDIINKAIKDYMATNPKEGKNYTFSFPLEASKNDIVSLSSKWKNKVENGLVSSVKAEDPIVAELANGNLTIKLSEEFNAEHAILKEENEWAINEIKDLQELSENLTQRVLELQNKIGG